MKKLSKVLSVLTVVAYLGSLTAFSQTVDSDREKSTAPSSTPKLGSPPNPNPSTDHSNETFVNTGHGNGASGTPSQPTVILPKALYSSSSSLPDNGGVPPTVTAHAPSYSSTLPENGGVPPTVVIKTPSRDVSSPSTLPDNGGAPPALTNAPPSYSSTIPDNGGTPPVVPSKVPPHDLGYSSTIPDNGGAPPVVAPSNPEHAPTNPPTVPK